MKAKNIILNSLMAILAISCGGDNEEVGPEYRPDSYAPRPPSNPPVKPPTQITDYTLQVLIPQLEYAWGPEVYLDRDVTFSGITIPGKKTYTLKALYQNYMIHMMQKFTYQNPKSGMSVFAYVNYENLDYQIGVSYSNLSTPLLYIPARDYAGRVLKDSQGRIIYQTYVSFYELLNYFVQSNYSYWTIYVYQYYPQFYYFPQPYVYCGGCTFLGFYPETGWNISANVNIGGSTSSSSSNSDSGLYIDFGFGYNGGNISIGGSGYYSN